MKVVELVLDRLGSRSGAVCRTWRSLRRLVNPQRSWTGSCFCRF